MFKRMRSNSNWDLLHKTELVDTISVGGGNNSLLFANHQRKKSVSLSFHTSLLVGKEASSASFFDCIMSFKDKVIVTW